MIVKLYTVFIGLLLALFAGVGIAAFYPAPQEPEYPAELMTAPVKDGGAGAETAEAKAQRIKYEQDQKDYLVKFKDYNRNVSLISLAAAIALLVLGLTLLKATPLMADGLTLGAVFTLIYSIVRGFASNDNMFRFLVVSVGLGVALFIGYVKFAKPLVAKPAARK